MDLLTVVQYSLGGLLAGYTIMAVVAATSNGRERERASARLKTARIQLEILRNGQAYDCDKNPNGDQQLLRGIAAALDNEKILEEGWVVRGPKHQAVLEMDDQELFTCTADGQILYRYYYTHEFYFERAKSCVLRPRGIAAALSSLRQADPSVVALRVVRVTWDAV